MKHPKAVTLSLPSSSWVKFLVLLVNMVVFANFVAGQESDSVYWKDSGFAYYGYSIQATPDNGYVVAGFIKKFGRPPRDNDALCIKVDSTGNVVWSRSFGGKMNDRTYVVDRTMDGGYVLAGETHSFGAGSFDAWLIKLGADGKKEWDKTYGGPRWDNAVSVRQTRDGGYILVGYTESFGEGKTDAWLVKVDRQGNVEWEKTYGGRKDDRGSSVYQSGDGGYVVAGYTESFGNGFSDIWLFKTDEKGVLLWEKTFGGVKTDRGFSAQPTKDGGVIIVGDTYSFGAGYGDVWVIKTDSRGNEQWQQTYGGSKTERGAFIQQTGDGGYVLTGFVKAGRERLSDVLLIKTDSTGREEWQHTFGGRLPEEGFYVLQTADGGYIVSGFTKSFTNGRSILWLIKTDDQGREVWNNTFGQKR
ncbi:MAG: hypothetical protein GXO92_01215 [FCB group bacterium]|nr:hypothetical protein [FCB group bacterium]